MYGKNCHKGRYSVTNTQKYIGNPTEVFYRSLWELKFMKWCDFNSSIIEWSSETIIIPYLSPIDNKMHRYFVDFYMHMINKDNIKEKYLIEIKPFRFTQPPKEPKKKSKAFIQEVMTYGVNQSKWKNAEAYCKTKGWKFMIITEKELGK